MVATRRFSLDRGRDGLDELLVEEYPQCLVVERTVLNNAVIVAT